MYSAHIVFVCLFCCVCLFCFVCCCFFCVRLFVCFCFVGVEFFGDFLEGCVWGVLGDLRNATTCPNSLKLICIKLPLQLRYMIYLFVSVAFIYLVLYLRNIFYWKFVYCIVLSCYIAFVINLVCFDLIWTLKIIII